MCLCGCVCFSYRHIFPLVPLEPQAVRVFVTLLVMYRDKPSHMCCLGDLNLCYILLLLTHKAKEKFSREENIFIVCSA